MSFKTYYVKRTVNGLLCAYEDNDSSKTQYLAKRDTSGLLQIEVSGTKYPVRRTSLGSLEAHVTTLTGYCSVWYLDNSNPPTVRHIYDTGSGTDDIAIDSSGNVYVVGGRNNLSGSYASVWKLDSSGRLLWTFDTGDDTCGVAVDSSDNVYIVGTKNLQNHSVWKLNSSGTLLWTFDTGNDANGVAVDGDGIIVVGDAMERRVRWKLSSSGELLWSDGVNSEDRAYCVTVGSNGDIVVGCNPTGVWTVYKDMAGVALGQFADCFGVAMDSSNNIYAAVSADHTLYKWDSSFNLLWTFDVGYPGNNVAVDSSDNVYLVGSNINYSVWKLNSSGTLLWSFDTGSVAQGIAVDGSGNLYVAGDRMQYDY